MEQTPRYGVAATVTAPDKDRVECFRQITEQMADLYEKKNKDYRNSYSKSIERYGAVAGLVHISYKFNRLENLMLNGECEIKDESIKDTLMDLANYAIMLYMEVK